MSKIPVIAIFDVGKTNKKLFLFDEDYHIVFERSAHFNEIADEDGFPCENLASLKMSVFEAISEVSKLKEFDLKAVNFSAYGATFVLLGEDGEPVAPLYNYLKPYPEELSAELYNKYGGVNEFSLATASPALGSLNSGLQLYRLKNEQSEVFKKLKYALHLPQYFSLLLTGQFCSDITSIGCHTALWDFGQNKYHRWVEEEGVLPKLATIKRSDSVLKCALPGAGYQVGIGLHDSSAALIPYLRNFSDPFVLISTGTWSISMNPFNHLQLTASELENDCLCYLSYEGTPVKSSRLFAGHEHDEQITRIAEYFNADPVNFKNMPFNRSHISGDKTFDPDNISRYKNAEEAYHQFMLYLVEKQATSTDLILKDSPVKKIFVDGGFSRNKIFMNLLARVFPDHEVFAASMAQASALGAALAIHHGWNKKPVPADFIQLQRYTAGKPING